MARVQYQCSECGATAPKWTGYCNECNTWNTFSEVIVEKNTQAKSFRRRDHIAVTSKIYPLDRVQSEQQIRLTTGMVELDRVIGGGLTVGSVILLGGDPGIGKSTLLIQVLCALANTNIKVLYVSAEESAQQIKLRAQRLELPLEQTKLLTENNLERILALTISEAPQVMVIDSIQTVYTEMLQSAPGSVAQVRESAAQMVRYAKQSNTTVLLIGHVTKDGSLAGPRILEHIVDTVLYFEGDNNSRFRIIRAIKNRYGAVNELGVFAMTDKGLREVSNPSALFLSRHQQQVPGSVIMVTKQGTRPLLIEIQALVAESHISNPRRVSVGLEQNRLSMLLAILHRHAGIISFDQDVFINAVGGIRVSETAADLAIVLAVISSLRSFPLAKDLIVFGELGLAGEIRPVQNGTERLNEAIKHGFKQAIIPRANNPKKNIKGMQIKPVDRLEDAIAIITDS